MDPVTLHNLLSRRVLFKSIRFLFACFLLGIFVSVSVFSLIPMFASALSNPYSPGQTLDPDCLPGDLNCTVANLWTNSGNDVLFNQVGNLGIGSTSPAYKLTTNGNGYFAGDLTATGTLTAFNFSGISVGDNTGDETSDTIKSKLGTSSAITDGFLSATDWNTFNNKVSSVSPILTTPNIGDATANSILNGGGSVAIPSYSFSADTSSGLSMQTPGTLDFSVGGIDKLSLNPTNVQILSDLSITGNLIATNFSGTSTGINTGDQDLSTFVPYSYASSTYAFSNNVLALNNITAFTPTGNYNPATKKYVDDLIAGIGSTSSSSAGLTLTTITASGTAAVGNLYVNGSSTISYVMTLPAGSTDGSTIGFLNTSAPDVSNAIALFDFSNYTDRTGNITLTNSGCTINNTIYKYGGSSLYCPGASNSINGGATNPASYNFGSNNWTIEGWIYEPGTWQHNVGLWTFGNNGVNNGIALWSYNDNSSHKTYLSFDMHSSDGTSFRTDRSVQPDISRNLSPDTWYHFAMVRNGNNLNSYVNGVLYFTDNVAGKSWDLTNLQLMFGKGMTSNYYSNVYIDDFKVSNVAKYTSDFTPPGAQFSASSITVTPNGSESIVPYANGQSVVLDTLSSKLSLLKYNGKWYDVSFSTSGGGGGGGSPLPSQTGNAGKYLTTNGTSESWSYLNSLVDFAVGTTTSSARLTVIGADNASTTATVNILNASSSPLFYVNNGGFVGIGTTTPSSKLTVSGDVMITGGLLDNNQSAGTAGMVLQSTGTGFNWVSTSSLNISGGYNYSTVTNTALGYLSFNSNITGSDNVAVGISSLYSNTTGVQNTAIGQTALWGNTTGSGNTAIGNETLESNATGTNNTAIGNSALVNHISGDFNTANGVGSLENNTTGNNNTVLGSYSLFSNATGSNNVALGNFAGSNELGSNTFYVDNQQRSGVVMDRTGALLYGTFDIDPSVQTLTINASTTIAQELTVLGIGTSSFAGYLSATNLSGVNSGDVALSNNINGLTISGQALTLGLAGTSATGTLSATDWNTFNGKQSPLTFIGALVNNSGTVSMTGDVSTPGGLKYFGTNISGTRGYFDLPSGGGISTTSWGFIQGTLSNQTDLQNALNLKASLSGATFTGAISASNFTGTSTGINTGDESSSTIRTKLGFASSSAGGYLTSSDWSTFNNKLGPAVISSLTGNYLPLWNATTSSFINSDAYQTVYSTGTSTTNFGTWTAMDGIHNWTAVSLSSTGQYQTGVVSLGQIYVSSDYGSTWTAKATNQHWYGVSLSSTGQYQTAVVNGGQIYVSSDYGSTWAAKDAGRNWQAVSISSTGQYQTAGVYGSGLYVSSNYGANWNPIALSRNWYGVSLSSTGQYQTAIVYGGQIYVSTTSGATWTAKDSARNWSSVSISSTGQYQTATVYSGQIYISSDYGSTWTAKDSARNWSGVSISSSSQNQLAVVNPGQIYASSDAGNTWTPRDGTHNWVDVSISSDGSYASAVETGSYVYVAPQNFNNVVNTGSLALGTTTPLAKLTVAGGAYFSGSAYVTDTLSVASSTGFSYFLSNLGVGTSSSMARLTLKGTDTSNTTNALSILNGSSTSLFNISNAGNVGINTSSQTAYRLAITGNTYTTGNVNVGGNSDLFGYVNIGSAPTGHKLAVNGDAYFGSNNNSNLVHRGLTGTFNDVPDIAVNGNYTYLISPSNYLKVIDVTDPTTPTTTATLTSVAPYAFSDPRGIEVDPYGYAYIASYGSSALEIVSVADPYTPVHVGRIATTTGGAILTNASNVSLDGGYGRRYVYVTSYTGDALEVVDVSDPYNPVHAGKFASSTAMNAPVDVKVWNGIAYVLSSSGLTMIDVSNPASPTFMSRIADGTGGAALNPGVNGKMVIDGPYVYVAAYTSNAFEIVNVGDPYNPIHAGKLTYTMDNTLYNPSNVAVAGNFAYVTCYSSHVVNIINITDPTNPFSANLSGRYHTPGFDATYPWAITIMGNYAYVSYAYTDDQFEVFEITQNFALFKDGWLGLGIDNPTFPIQLSSGAHVTEGGAWTNASSRDLKENFTQLNKVDILNKIAQIDLTQWNYKLENASTTHIGPIAEDFYALFGLGGTNKSISTIDPAGIALVGIQVLNKNLNIIFGTSSIEYFASSTANMETYNVTDFFVSLVEKALEKISGIFINTNLSVKQIQVQNGIVIKDKITGDNYCMTISDGEIVKEKGDCSVNNETVATSTDTAVTTTETSDSTSTGDTTIITDSTSTPVDITASSTDSITSTSTDITDTTTETTTTNSETSTTETASTSTDTTSSSSDSTVSTETPPAEPEVITETLPAPSPDPVVETSTPETPPAVQ
jgi:hypothetical protein